MNTQEAVRVSINQDDWYEYDTKTLEVFVQHGSKSNPQWSDWMPPVAPEGRSIKRGMRLWGVSLWRKL